MQNAIKMIRKPVLFFATTVGGLGVLIVARTLVDGYRHGSTFGDCLGNGHHGFRQRMQRQFYEVDVWDISL